MNKCCKDNWVNLAGGFVECEICGDESFFTDLGISADTLIVAGGYASIDSNGSIPANDVEMIRYFYQQQIIRLLNRTGDRLE